MVYYTKGRNFDTLVEARKYAVAHCEKNCIISLGKFGTIIAEIKNYNGTYIVKQYHGNGRYGRGIYVLKKDGTIWDTLTEF